MDSQAPAQLIVCEVCGSFFDSRRGLANHARGHLRQLGVSEPGAAPIDLLNRLIAERDGEFPSFKTHSSFSEFSPNHQTSHQGASPVCADEGTMYNAGHRVSTTPQSTSLLPLSSPALKMLESRLSDFGNSSTLETLTKPLWAPLATDAPITLDTNEELHVCHLCGCWCETRKGLSSHARSHLRQLGIPDGDGNPIETLYQLMEEEDLKPVNCEAPSALQPSPLAKGTKRPADVSSPTMSTPNKQPKKGKFYCVLCGETFENHKGLAIHSRYHLRHFGVDDLLGKESSIEAIQELIESGVLKPLPKTNSPVPTSPVQALSPISSKSPPMAKGAPKAKKGFRFAVEPFFRKPKPENTERSISDVQMVGRNSPLPAPKLFIADTEKPPTVPCDYCSQLFDTRKALSCHVRCHLRELGVALPLNTSPIELLKEIMTQQDDEGKRTASSALGSAKVSGKPQLPKRSLDSLVLGEQSSKSNSPLDFSMKEKVPCGKMAAPRNDCACELCGFEFDNRKALASHARAHLRQLGIEWKPDGSSSPIELLSDIIRKDPAKVAEVTQRYRMGDLYIRKTQRSSSPSLSTDSDSVQGGLKEKNISIPSSFRQTYSHSPTVDPNVHSTKVMAHAPKQHPSIVEEIQDSSSQPTARPGSIPAMLPKPPLTPLVKVVGKVYSLKCRFCDEVFHGPLSVQEKWITHLQKHIRTLGYKGKASPPSAPVKATTLVRAVAV
ncbi:protein Wiz isoform X2 [Periophthalmus magnuspinnatus]|uniref:protein Wiz isoform X2 n=1 Tax=Periophthalmus magnuspinnatus TaxID=409849 RepID=UPI00145B964C|nr:protein Wiz isoform X2 [Periophthalmus magnuspinnatus]